LTRTKASSFYFLFLNMSDEIQRILHGRLTVSLSDKHKYSLTDVDLKQWAICILRKNAHESFSLMFYILSKAIDGSWSATKSHTFNRDTTAVYSFLKANCLTTKIRSNHACREINICIFLANNPIKFKKARFQSVLRNPGNPSASKAFMYHGLLLAKE
jgi:hypothetical protein